jgi:hypothetical protein
MYIAHHGLVKQSDLTPQGRAVEAVDLVRRPAAAGRNRGSSPTLAVALHGTAQPTKAIASSSEAGNT